MHGHLTTPTIRSQLMPLPTTQRYLVRPNLDHPYELPRWDVLDSEMGATVWTTTDEGAAVNTAQYLNCPVMPPHGAPIVAPADRVGGLAETSYRRGDRVLVPRSYGDQHAVVIGPGWQPYEWMSRPQRCWRRETHAMPQLLLAFADGAFGQVPITWIVRQGVAS